MKKFRYMLRMAAEMLELIREHKLYFLAPLLLALVAVSALVYYVGPTVVITFIYAGV
ncbi:MAG: hypothetical protein FJ090_07420 [Deltaproteobacteria bacterium]|nr:hypothetical protein [Deltaproteobacteria bacterium]